MKGEFIYEINIGRIRQDRCCFHCDCDHDRGSCVTSGGQIELPFQKITKLGSDEIDNFVNSKEDVKGEAFAVLVENDDMLTITEFDYDSFQEIKKDVHSESLFFVRSVDPNFKNTTTYDGKKVLKIYDGIETTDYSDTRPEWLLSNSLIINVDVKDYIKPINTRFWFQNLDNCKNMDLSKLDTSNVTDMTGMFEDCESLLSLDLSSWDTSNVKEMELMFDFCKSLTTLDLNNWNTSNVTTMSQMFDHCSNLTELKVENFNTSNVIDMFMLFSNCDSLISLDLSNWDTSNVKEMEGLFYYCPSLTTVNVSKLNTSSVTTMSRMFYHCISLIGVDISNFDISNVTSMRDMFWDCRALTNKSIKMSETIYNKMNMLLGGSSFKNYIGITADKFDIVK